jgi:hypothetical protein
MTSGDDDIDNIMKNFQDDDEEEETFQLKTSFNKDEEEEKEVSYELKSSSNKRYVNNDNDNNNNNNNNNNKNKNKESSFENNRNKRHKIIFEDIKKDYEENLVSTVINNIPIHKDPKNIIKNNKDRVIQQIKDRIDNEDRVKDILNKNPLWRFAVKLNGLIKTKVPSMASLISNVSLEESNSNTQFILQGSEKSLKSIQEQDIERIPPSSSSSKKKTIILDEEDEEDNNFNSNLVKTQHLKYVESVMRSTNVSGVAIFSDVTDSKIQEALSNLNFSEGGFFENVTLDAFVNNDDSMEIFARYVVSIFFIDYISSMTRYQSDATLPRAKKSSIDILDQITKHFVFLKNKNLVVKKSIDQINEDMQKICHIRRQSMTMQGFRNRY